MLTAVSNGHPLTVGTTFIVEIVHGSGAVPAGKT
jgi:hypothetical protein